jgi:1-acyl-sn-glycerol-3-phosphate acyltransferase
MAAEPSGSEVGGRARQSRPRLIPAYKRGWPRLAVEAMIAHKVRGGFHQILAQGLESLRAELDRDPRGTLFLANHSNWWDLFLVHALNQAIPVDGYGMMEHFNMLRFGFFRRIGAFSVDRTDPGSVRASLAYASGLLQRPRAGVWIFPQGKIETNDARPLVFQAGIRALVRRAGPVRVVPVAFRYEFWQDERPEALVRFGTSRVEDREGLTDLIPRLEHALTLELDALREDAIRQDRSRFTPLLRGQVSISERYANVRARFRGPTPGAPA